MDDEPWCVIDGKCPECGKCELVMRDPEDGAPEFRCDACGHQWEMEGEAA